VIRDLGRVVKDPWKTGPVEIEIPAFIAELPRIETVSVRLEASLQVTGDPQGKARRLEASVLAFRRGGAETGRISGDAARLELLEVLVGTSMVEDARSLPLPKDLAAFDRRRRERVELVAGLLAEGRGLVEEVERLVCTLYGLPDELADAVVEHALKRAGSAMPAESD
jgi:hypothetical protein